MYFEFSQQLIHRSVNPEENESIPNVIVVLLEVYCRYLYILRQWFPLSATTI